MIPTNLTIPSFAKINWQLRILGKRPDGYHELSTILQTISLHDLLNFERTGDGTVALECTNNNIPTDDTNLIVRAAHLLKARYLVQAGARINLDKTIPVKAGLGGGSSNAATSLLALAYLWEIQTDLPTLMELASELGADVPFFFFGGTALGTGTGTTISARPDVVSQHLVLVTPNAGVSTADAYAALNSPALTTLEADPILSNSPTGRDFSELQPALVSDDLENDFESVIFDMEPEIRRAKEALLHSGARDALLAGSGSTVFGVFPDRQSQGIAIDKIQLEAGWQVFPCVTLSRNEYFRALSVNEISLLRFFNLDSEIGA